MSAILVLPASKMTIPKIIVLIFLSLLGKGTIAQTMMPQKQYLLAAIRESTEDDYSLNRTWTACNTDSAFFKTDTIRLYNNKNYQTGIGCCNYINWMFENEESFRQNSSFPCTEPPGESIYFDDSNLFGSKITEKGDALYFNVYQHDRLRSKFKVLSIQSTKISNGELTNELILVRVN